MEGVSVSTFVIQAARARAKALLRRRRLIRLSDRARQLITTPLESRHDRAAFSCGKASLDNYLRDRAMPDAKGLSTITFVLLDPEDQRTIQGYFSLSSTSIEFGIVPKDVAKRLRISRHRTMSAILIGRLAVSTPFTIQELTAPLTVCTNATKPLSPGYIRR